MSDIIETAVNALNERIEGSIDSSVKFQIEGVGAIRIDENGVSQDDSEADCTLIADQDVFQSIMSGDLNPTSAFMSGKLRVEGDMSAAMKLGSLLA